MNRERTMGTRVRAAIDIRTILVIALLLIAAQSWAGKYALIIGNSEYAHVSALKNPANDARDTGGLLERLGFDTEIVLDGNITRMEEAVRRYTDKLSKDQGGDGIFYYAGHAVQDGGTNYLLPVDADIRSVMELQRKALSLQEVLGYIGQSGNRFNLVVLDACRDNPFKGSFRSASRGLAVTTAAPPETLVVYATDAGNVAEDGEGRNSPFTEAFLENILNPDMDVEAMMREVTADVYNSTGGRQRPWRYSSLTRSITLADAASVAAARRAANSTISASAEKGARGEEKVPSGTIQVTLLSPGTVYLNGIPRGKTSPGSPLLLEEIPEGDHTVSVIYDNGKQASIDTYSTSLRTVEARFLDAFGSLEVSARLDGKVAVEGDIISSVEAGKTITLKDVPAGRISLSIFYDDGMKEEVRVLVRENRRSEHSFTYDGTFSVGDRGPAGGIIILDRGRTYNTWRYLEVAPEDSSSSAPWAPSSVMVRWLGEAIGTGKDNTRRIVEAFGDGTYAAAICNNLEYGGFDDWFLPSKEELALMYQHRELIGGFSNNQYWSSSEYDERDAWRQYFYYGYQQHDNKLSSFRVRAIRAF